MNFKAPETAIAISDRVKQILDLLKAEYGIAEPHPHDDPISVLVQTILSQNTSDTNSNSAFRSLVSCFKNWEEIATADVDTIARCIRSGGLGRIKAQRIKQALTGISHQRGKLELDFLSQLSLPDAEDWLQQLPGVGLKTARCVLLFSLGMPALPVDTHILRVTKRVGLISPQATLDAAHRTLAELVAPDDVYQFHILVIEHGRRTCQARHPHCQVCVLKNICNYYTLSRI